MILGLAAPGPNAFLAVIFVAVLALVALGIVRSQHFALGLLLALFIPSYAMRDQVDLSTNVGSVHVMALDVLCALLLVLGLFRAVTARRHTVLGATAFFFVLLLALHFGRGAAIYGLQAATNASRSWFYPLSCLIFAATVPTPWDRRAWRLIALAGLALSAIALPYLFSEGFHSSGQQVLVNGEFVNSRPVVAAGALLILQAVIVFVAMKWPSVRGALYATAFAGAALLLLQHRTVWAAAIAAGLIGFLGWARQRGREEQSFVVGATALVALAFAGAVWALAQSSTLRVSVGETTQKRSTFQWRLDSWGDLISNHHSATDVVIGEPAGTSWARQIFGETTDVSAHSSFVESFLRFGVGGIALLVLLVFFIFRSRLRIARLTGLTPIAVTLLLLTQVLFAITYTLSAVDGMILGIFVSALAWEGELSIEEQPELAPGSDRYYAVAPSL